MNYLSLYVILFSAVYFNLHSHCPISLSFSSPLNPLREPQAAAPELATEIVDLCVMLFSAVSFDLRTLCPISLSYFYPLLSLWRTAGSPKQQLRVLSPKFVAVSFDL
jgi:hypothetical protein